MERKNEFETWMKLFQVQGELNRRLFAAQKAIELGYGGISHISTLTGLSRTTITKGISELKSRKNINNEKSRCPGVNGYEEARKNGEYYN